MSNDEREPMLTRRQVLAGATAVAGAAVVGRPAVARAAQATSAAAAAPGWKHGGGLAQRGVDIAAAKGRQSEGRFGLMFKKLDAFAPPDDALVELGKQMAEPSPPTPRPTQPDPLDAPGLAAGFTFLGQFIDHDMTFDQTPLTDQQVDPHGLTNFDTARFDLASVYGNGPTGSPELYGSSGRLRLVQPQGIDDLPRRPDGTAYIGDPRNEENLILCQLHIAFVKFHNRLIDEGHSFAEAQRLTQWHFQWILVHDYLPHVVGQPTVDRFLVEKNGRVRCERAFYKPKNPQRPMMPIEYAVAAFRFGHSMVRPGYLMNRPPSGPVGGPMFDNPPSDDDLHGSRPIPAKFEIDWREFFEIAGSTPSNVARRIDTVLSPPLHKLPSTVVPTDVVPVISDLAQRNLLRGKRVGLPAGQDVARAMGITPLSNADLGNSDVGNSDPALGLQDPVWGGKAPLWFYILAEAGKQPHAGLQLGDVGGRIVAETILGLIDCDKDSYFQERDWKPMSAGFGIGDLLAFAQGA